eukprot:403347484
MISSVLSAPKAPKATRPPKRVIDLGQAPTAKAGMTTTFTQKFFDDYRGQVMDLLQTNLNDLSMPDSSQDFNVGIGKVFLTLTQQKLTSFSIDKNRSTIKIQDQSPNLLFRIEGVNLDFAMQFNLQSKPAWIQDKGQGTISIKDLTIAVSLAPYNKKGKMQVDFTDALIDIKDYSADFQGSSDFSKVFNIILRSFKSFFKNEVANVLAMKITSTFEDSFNSMLYTGPSILSMKEDTIFMNYTLTGDPIFTKDYMSVPFDGSFIQKVNQTFQPGAELLDIPSYYEAGKQLQIFISEGSLNSALSALHTQGWLKLEQDDILSTVVSMIFDNFEKVYGSSQKLRIFMESDEPKPVLKITQKETVIEAQTKLHIKNPYNSEYDAALITSKLTIQLELEVTQNFNLTGKVKKISFEVQGLQTFFESDTTVEDVQERIDLFVTPIQSSMNQKLRKGVRLPVPDLIITDVSNSELIQFNGFIMIQADPKIVNTDKKII